MHGFLTEVTDVLGDAQCCMKAIELALVGSRARVAALHNRDRVCEKGVHEDGGANR